MARELAVFFDIGDTLADPVVVAGRLSGLSVYPFVPEVLHRVRMPGNVAVGLISNTGHETAATLHQLLVDAALWALVDADLCLFSSVEGLDKSQPALFVRSAERAGLPAADCVFVGESEAERTVAASTGMRVSPHPLHALHLVETVLSDHPLPHF